MSNTFRVTKRKLTAEDIIAPFFRDRLRRAHRYRTRIDIGDGSVGVRCSLLVIRQLRETGPALRKINVKVEQTTGLSQVTKARDAMANMSQLLTDAGFCAEVEVEIPETVLNLSAQLSNVRFRLVAV